MKFALKKAHKNLTKKILIFLLVFALGIIVGYGIFAQNRIHFAAQNQSQKDRYIAFSNEIYDKIKENYWDLISDEQLTNLYKQAAEKITGKPQKLKLGNENSNSSTKPQDPTKNPSGLSLDLQGTSITDLKLSSQSPKSNDSSTKIALDEMLKNILKDLDDTKKKDFTKNLATAVLANLSPFGRSGLYSQKQEEQLKNTVQNINPEKDLYKDLGLGKGASKEEAQKAYDDQAAKLREQIGDEAKKKLEQIAYAKDVLTQEDKKKNYDEAKIEPTVFSKFYTPDIVYIKFLKFSPTTYDEFVKLISTFDKPDGPNALIFDLRNNVGGAIDSLPFFLGNFLGDKQYAYEFMHKGESEPFKTTGQKLPGLAHFKQVVILIDNQTQSSAELMAAALKRYHFGILLGQATKGWGTVEKIFALDNQIDEHEKFSMFLVHSITLRDDGQPIEGRGVEPNINTKDQNWQSQLFSYFRNPDLTSSVKQAIFHSLGSNLF